VTLERLRTVPAAPAPTPAFFACVDALTSICGAAPCERLGASPTSAVTVAEPLDAGTWSSTQVAVAVCRQRGERRQARFKARAVVLIQRS
jgi:hypothetical protein